MPHRRESANRHTKGSYNHEFLHGATNDQASYKCAEQVHTWIYANRPCALDNKEFLSGLYVIIEMEVEQALRRQRAPHCIQLWPRFGALSRMIVSAFRSMAGRKVRFS